MLPAGAGAFLQAINNRIVLSMMLGSALLLPGSAGAQGTPRPTVSAPAQNVDGILDQSYRAMYNLQFDEALRQTEQAKKLTLDDPVPWMAQACAILFREFDRLHVLRSELFGAEDRFADGPPLVWNPQNKAAFDGALSGSEKIALERLKHDKNDP